MHDGKTAALVTPDRALARRVLAALARWNIAAEDSGGDALADTPAGIFARLAAAAALGGLAPVTLLALLKHPLLRLELARQGTCRRRARTRDLARPAAAPGARLGTRCELSRRSSNNLRHGEAVELHPSDPRNELTDARA